MNIEEHIHAFGPYYGMAVVLLTGYALLMVFARILKRKMER